MTTGPTTGPTTTAPRTKLHAALQSLHDELRQTGALDATAQTWLETVLQDIKLKLEAQQPGVVDAAAAAAGSNDAAYENAASRLEDAALAFEAKHPKLATLATELAESLRAAGV